MHYTKIRADGINGRVISTHRFEKSTHLPWSADSNFRARIVLLRNDDNPSALLMCDRVSRMTTIKFVPAERKQNWNDDRKGQRFGGVEEEEQGGASHVTASVWFKSVSFFACPVLQDILPRPHADSIEFAVFDFPFIFYFH